jgi:DNA-directed RNA polymerase subunit RPC12/RpoP
VIEANVFFGHHCSRCGTTIGVAAAVGIGTLTCPVCGGPMEAAPGGPPVRNLANVVCKKCGSVFGMIVSVGSSDIRCPKCGEPL